uniref:GDSL esterase/lipase n=1 Tax=Davidia involucrata TaxID=16924 RepID=A0A5B7A3Q1_DAVIN
MMKSNFLFFLLLFLFSPSYAHNKIHEEASSSSSSSLQGSFQGSFSKVFAFGSSYTDTGNAQLLGGLNPSAGSTANNNNRLSNGRLVVDFLCEALNIPHLPPYKDTSSNFTHGVNFAVAGSTSLPNDFFSGNGLLNTLMYWKNKATLSFQTQIDWFNQFVQGVACKGKDQATCKAEMGKALFWIGEMGVNDYTRTSGSSFSFQKLAEMSVGHVSKLIQNLVDAGAKHIVVHGLPPVGCLSSGISLSPLRQFDKLGCAAGVNSMIMFHNQILQKKLAIFRTMFPDCKIIYADYWNAYLTILKNRTKYNFGRALQGMLWSWRWCWWWWW